MNKKSKKNIIKIITLPIASICFIAIIAFVTIDTNKANAVLNNNFMKQQWGLNNYGQTINDIKGIKGIDINILKAWEITKGSSDVVIGILDSGIDISNIEIKNSIFKNNKEIPDNTIDDDQNGYIDDTNGWNFYGNDNIIYEKYLYDYHGTFISGIIAATGEDGSISGVAPGVKLLPLKFLKGSEGLVEDAIKAIEYADSIGITIINCSWDSTTYDDKLYKVMKKYNNILFICSAGKNADDLNNTPVFPACFNLPNVISVVAIDSKGEIYANSGYGDKADVAAPGVNIYSCFPEGNYTFSSGTSEATAYVSGIAGLIKSINFQLSANQIADILKNNSKYLESLKNEVRSEGIIDAYECLKDAQVQKNVK